MLQAWLRNGLLHDSAFVVDRLVHNLMCASDDVCHANRALRVLERCLRCGMQFAYRFAAICFLTQHGGAKVKRILWLGFAIIVALNFGAPAFTLAGPPIPIPTPPPAPLPVPDQACTQVPELCLHQ